MLAISGGGDKNCAGAWHLGPCRSLAPPIAKGRWSDYDCTLAELLSGDKMGGGKTSILLWVGFPTGRHWDRTRKVWLLNGLVLEAQSILWVDEDRLGNSKSL